uniref:Reverse transcriptase n=2 Tax=Cannabis sativa TaxID=3483 RepID=A0A803PT88_CANSA
MDTRRRICEVLQVLEAGADSLYLGLPSIVDRNKNVVLGFLKERMRKRINSLEGKFLSRAGKEVLIKSMLQSLPSYAMNVFLFPIGTCKELERLMASFWWKSNKSNSNGSGIVWMNWDRMTRNKAEGGMGFRNLRDFNLAMLGKQGWRFMLRHDSLVSKIFKARYYPQGDFLSTELGSNPSFIWSSIFAAKDTVKLGLRKGIGSGLTVDITSDPCFK